MLQRNSANQVMCIGVDLAWKAGNWSGVAVAHLNSRERTMKILNTEWVREKEKILKWATNHDRKTTVVVAIDAPIFAPNRTRGRQCDRDLSSDFWDYEAGCHPAFLSKCAYPIEFRTSLQRVGFCADPARVPQSSGLWQVEVYPHPWQVVLFKLKKTIKYKKNGMDSRRRELGRLVQYMQQYLSQKEPRLVESPELQELYDLGTTLKGKAFKEREDRLDAVVCAYSAAYFWLWGENLCHVYYSDPQEYQKGYIVTPRLAHQ